MNRDQWIRETRARGSGLGLLLVYGMIVATMIFCAMSIT